MPHFISSDPLFFYHAIGLAGRRKSRPPPRGFAMCAFFVAQHICSFGSFCSPALHTKHDVKFEKKEDGFQLELFSLFYRSVLLRFVFESDDSSTKQPFKHVLGISRSFVAAVLCLCGESVGPEYSQASKRSAAAHSPSHSCTTSLDQQGVL